MKRTRKKTEIYFFLMSRRQKYIEIVNNNSKKRERRPLHHRACTQSRLIPWCSRSYEEHSLAEAALLTNQNKQFNLRKTEKRNKKKKEKARDLLAELESALLGGVASLDLLALLELLLVLELGVHLRPPLLVPYHRWHYLHRLLLLLLLLISVFFVLLPRLKRIFCIAFARLSLSPHS